MILILCVLSILSIILLFFRPLNIETAKNKTSSKNENLFAQVIEASVPALLKLWEEGDASSLFEGADCKEEINHEKNVGKSYYQCNPHFWQCFWQGGLKSSPSLKIDLYGQTYHVNALPAFNPIPEYSPKKRFYSFIKNNSGTSTAMNGYKVEIAVKEIPGFVQPIILIDTCRDTYLPQRVYNHGQSGDKLDEGFLWDNIGRNIFVDKFYVTNRQVNEWRLETGKVDKFESDRKKWPHPSLLPLDEQVKFCQFHGKRLLEAKIFDAASMFPIDLKNPIPLKIYRPQTHWQRDLSKTFLGMARLNSDYQLTPLDCGLAEVKGCDPTFFSSDSASWMGMHFSLGFYSESLQNSREVYKNLKMSSRLLPPSSSWHELGLLTNWKGEQRPDFPVAFRCYEEVSL